MIFIIFKSNSTLHTYYYIEILLNQKCFNIDKLSKLFLLFTIYYFVSSICSFHGILLFMTFVFCDYAFSNNTNLVLISPLSFLGSWPPCILDYYSVRTFTYPSTLISGITFDTSKFLDNKSFLHDSYREKDKRKSLGDKTWCSYLKYFYIHWIWSSCLFN